MYGIALNFDWQLSLCPPKYDVIYAQPTKSLVQIRFQFKTGVRYWVVFVVSAHLSAAIPIPTPDSKLHKNSLCLNFENSQNFHAS